MHTGPGTENRHFYQKQTNFQTGSGSCFDLKHGSPMIRMFRKPVSVLDEKNNKAIMCFRIMFQIHLKEMRPWLFLYCAISRKWEPHRCHRGFQPRQVQSKDYKIGISCFSAKYAALRSKSKDWLARNRNNVAGWSDMSTRGLLFQ